MPPITQSHAYLALNSLQKAIKCSASLALYRFSRTRLINSLKHKHSIMYEYDPLYRILKMHHHIFVLFLQTVYAIEKLLAGFNVQPSIGMNQSLLWLHYHATLLMTSHGDIQHPAPFYFFKSIEAFRLVLCLNCDVYETISATQFIDFF